MRQKRRTAKGGGGIPDYQTSEVSGNENLMEQGKKIVPPLSGARAELLWMLRAPSLVRRRMLLGTGRIDKAEKRKAVPGVWLKRGRKWRETSRGEVQRRANTKIPRGGRQIEVSSDSNHRKEKGVLKREAEDSQPSVTDKNARKGNFFGRCYRKTQEGEVKILMGYKTLQNALKKEGGKKR